MMQNKSHKKIEDQGWKSMQVMLDKEMPVSEKPKRKFLFWYWMGGMTAVVAGVLFFTNFYSFEGKTPLDTNIVETTEKEINSATSVDQQEFISMTDDHIVDSKINTKEEVASITEENKEIVKTTNQAPFSTQETIRSTENKQPFQKQEVTVFHQNEKLTLVKEPISTAIKSNISTEKDRIVVLQELPMLTSLIDFDAAKPEFQFHETRKIEPVKKQKSKVQWALASNALITTEPRVNGYSSGVAIQIPVSKKLSLETGLNYRFTNQKFIEITESASERLLDLTWGSQHNGNGPLGMDTISSITELVPGAVQNSSNKNYEYTRQGNYHYISLPLNLNYSLSKSSNIQLGIAGSYLLNKDQNSSNFDLAIAADDNDPSFSYEFSGAVNQVNRLDMGIYVGYRFHINSKWAMNVGYHRGNLLQRNGWRISNRFFKLGAQYNL